MVTVADADPTRLTGHLRHGLARQVAEDLALETLFGRPQGRIRFSRIR